MSSDMVVSVCQRQVANKIQANGFANKVTKRCNEDVYTVNVYEVFIDNRQVPVV